MEEIKTGRYGKTFKSSFDPTRDVFKERIFTSLMVCFCVTMLLIGRHPVVGSSMFPTYKEGQSVISRKAIVPLQRNQVVVAYSPTGKLFIKRLAGLPNDTVEITKDGEVLINDKPYEYGHGDAMDTLFGDHMKDTDEGGKIIHLSDNEYFLIGDNFEHSADSRFYGTFHRWQILEVVIDLFS